LTERARGIASRPLAAFSVAAAVFAGASILWATGMLETVELGAYDRLLRRLPPAAGESPVVLVEIRESDIERFGHPMCDGLLARSLDVLLRAEPRVVGVDIYRDVRVPCGDRHASLLRPEEADLAEVAASDRVVWIVKFPDEPGGPVRLPHFLEDPERTGFSDMLVDPGAGIVRRGLLFLWDGDTPYLSFALRLALRYLGEEGIGLAPALENPEWLRLGATTIPALGPREGAYTEADAGGYQMLIDYARLSAGPLETHPLEALLAGQVPPSSLRGRIVILGTNAWSVKDHFYTPLSARLEDEHQALGMQIHAQIADQLVRFAHGDAAPIRGIDGRLESLWILLWCVLGASLGVAGRGPVPTGLAVLAGAFVLAGAAYGLLRTGWWLPVATPALAGAAAAGLGNTYAVLRERSERRQVTRLFSRFLRPAVADEIWRQRDAFMEGGRVRARRVVLTTLISDLQGYTGASEKLEPPVLMAWISEYMNTMADLVASHGGVVDDYAGDGIKANFGFPVASTSEADIARDATAAVRCALAMGEAMERLNAEWKRRGLPSGRVRVGIYTGAAVVGAVGGEQSLKYTSVGDAVNTAARLEGFDKDAHASADDASRVLIGGATADRLGDRFEWIELGEHKLRGKSEAVRIYRVLRERDAEGGSRERQAEGGER
jgi:adenylate cyclase